MEFDVNCMSMPMDDGVMSAINENISLMKRIGENIDTDNFLLFANNFHLPFLICEGLIKTYPSESVIKFIGEAFNLDYGGGAELDDRISKIFNGIHRNFSGRIYKKKNLREDTESIIIEKYKELENQEKLDFYMNKYGWFLSRVDDEKLTYERKYESYGTVFQFLLNGIDKLYHITDRKYLGKILKNGLKPKSAKSKSGYSHGERIYLFLKKPDSLEKEVSFAVDKVVLEIDLNLLNKTTKIYADPRLESGVYVLEPISPESLKILKN